MADNGSYYSKIDDRMCAAFRRLLSRADVITPNVTEAALLAGLPYEPGTHSDAYLAQLFQVLGALGAGVVTVTGVRPQPDVIGNVACDCRTGEMHASMRPAHPGVFYGTGDVFASALAALLVRGAPLSAALETATALTDESICRSLWRDTPRRFGVDFEGRCQRISAVWRRSLKHEKVTKFDPPESGFDSDGSIFLLPYFDAVLQKYVTAQHAGRKINARLIS